MPTTDVTQQSQSASREPLQDALITTPRLVLRKLTPNDLTAVLSCYGNPNVARFTMWDVHRSPEDTKNFLDDAMEGYRKGTILHQIGIAAKQDPALIIGTASCDILSEANKTAEISYVLRQDLWGKGLIVEACDALIEHIFTHYDINRIQACSLPGNVGSARVMTKLGLKFEGRLRESVLVKGKLQDVDMWSILRSERQHKH